MKVEKHAALREYTITDDEGTSFTIQQGKVYTTSPPKDDGTMRVYSRFWVTVPADVFLPGEKGPV